MKYLLQLKEKVMNLQQWIILF